MKNIEDKIEWFGVAMILLGSLAIAINIIDSNNYIFYVLNILGCAIVGYYSFKKKDLQPAYLNLIFAMIAIVGLVRVLM